MFVAKILILFLCGVVGLQRICSGSIYGDLQIYGSSEIAPVLVLVGRRHIKFGPIRAPWTIQHANDCVQPD